MSRTLPFTTALAALIVSTSLPTAAAEQAEVDYLRDTYSRVEGCFRQRQEQGLDGLAMIRCWPDESPRKCRELGAQRANAQSDPSKKQAWNRCVMSCATASYLAKHMGECSN
jgi:hypothetical protein